MYEIKVDAARGVVELTLGGMLSVEEVDEYIAALRAAFVANRLSSYAMLIDVSDCPIQSQSTIAEMQRSMGPMPKARAIALVTGSSLARMQIRRLFTQDYARIVGSREEGLAWVVSGIEPASAVRPG
ncbi:hypothetical protein [Sphingomonas sp. Y38-1Y]|uniref:hypothetical protein n=1 Tax=Sphingomonas sp. Y38-1Y TaxID=3078265 RepID=UPI0028EB4035|nr:hypothetical protein [Sphingomonas sp. Y38-1Y]